jgi:hypothetical protein
MTMMRTRALTRGLAAATFLTLTCTAVGWADPVPGKIDEASKTSVTVNGQRYAVESDTTIEDRSGTPVAVTELKPGTEVEIEVDGSRLVNLRAAVIR